MQWKSPLVPIPVLVIPTSLLVAMEAFLAIETHRHPKCNILYLLLSATAVLAQRGRGVPECFYPNGLLAVRDFACDLSAEITHCCGLGSICLDNGVCATGNNKRIRGSCTDQSWGPDCPPWCLGECHPLSVRAIPEL